MAEKDQETEIKNDNNATDTAATTSTSRKKAAKKATVKKASKKKVVKKAASKKALTKKKTVRKKGIKLKEESNDLDSFAEHAATEVISEETAVQLAAASPDADAVVEAADPVVAADAKIEEKKQEKTVEQIDKPVTAVPYEKPAVDKKVAEPVSAAPVSSGKPADDSGSFIVRLAGVVILFVGFAFYVQSIFEENRPSTAQQDTQPAVAETVAVTEAMIQPQVNMAPQVQETSVVPEPVPVPEAEMVIVVEPVAEVVAELPQQPVEPVVEPVSSGADSSAEITEQKTDQVEVVAESGPVGYPPPPAPPYLVMPKTPKPLPAEQMELIRQTFAPEMR